MNSFLSSLWVNLLMELLETMDTVEPLHTVGIEFTVLRENGLEIGCEMVIRCRLAEQKEDPLAKADKIYVELQNKKD